MLETLCLVMHAIPRVAECLREVRLDDAMAPNRPQCSAAAFARELHALVRLVRHEPLTRQPAKHPAHARRRDPERRRDLIRAGDAAARLELIDGLEIILDRPGELLMRALGRHGTR